MSSLRKLHGNNSPKCGQCGKRISYEILTPYWEPEDGEESKFICEECLKEYLECDACGRLIHLRDGEHKTDGLFTICCGCFENRNFTNEWFEGYLKQ